MDGYSLFHISYYVLCSAENRKFLNCFCVYLFHKKISQTGKNIEQKKVELTILTVSTT